jgi:hypothetical protein
MLRYEMTLDRTAVYSRVRGELSPSPAGPWAPLAPGGSEVTGVSVTGAERVRFYFPVPLEAPKQFLRVAVEP